jgi:DNA modification methylase
MGKSWDASGIAYSVELWKEVLRVLKPGGHLLAFSGSRTYHRMAVAIEDAGFEIRDQIMWIYGSGFPKSLDIAKAVDKNDATLARRERDLKFTEWMRSTGLKARQIDDITQSNMGGHYLTDKEQPTVATAEMFDKLRPYLPEVPEWVEEMVRQRTIESENFKKREVIGTKQGTKSIDGAGHGIIPGGITETITLDITAPATAEAKQWQGWGTALKPAHEPVVVARKPLIGTVAANVLTYGTGGLNIDGARVAYEEGGTIASNPLLRKESGAKINYGLDKSPTSYALKTEEGEMQINNAGRWPANVIHDGSDEVVELFPQSKAPKPYEKSKAGWLTPGSEHKINDLQSVEYGDSGSAARFFYCAKASKRDRNEGLEGFEAVRVHDGREEGGVGGSNPRNRTNTAKINHHPTVKPTDLMRYLCRLVTPPNGIVLDPFMGSGSTGKAAIYEGFNFVGIEMTDEYIPIAKARIEFAVNEMAEKLL